MTLVALSHAILAVAALAVSVACLGLAPALVQIAEDAAALLTGGRMRHPALSYRRMHSLARTEAVAAPGEGMVVEGAVAACFAATASCALLLPGFATGTPLSRFGDLPLVAGLLVVARFAALVAEFASGRSAAIGIAASLPFPAASLLPALLPVACAAACLGAGRADTLGQAASAADGATRLLLIAALALAAYADLEGERPLRSGLAGPVLALAEIASALRLLVWADLLAPFLPPLFIADAVSGPLSWIGSLLLWTVRTAMLAALLGLARGVAASLGGVRGPSSLGTATLLALLASLFVFIGGSFA